MTSQPQDSGTEVLALEQHENHEHDHETRGGELAQQRSQEGCGRRADFFAGHHHRECGRRIGGVGFGFVYLAQHLVDDVPNVLDRAPLAGDAQVGDFLKDIVPIIRQLVGQTAELKGDDGARGAQERESAYHCNDDRRRAAQAPAPKHVHHRTEDKGQKNGDRDRDYDFASPP